MSRSWLSDQSLCPVFGVVGSGQANGASQEENRQCVTLHRECFILHGHTQGKRRLQTVSF